MRTYIVFSGQRMSREWVGSPLVYAFPLPLCTQLVKRNEKCQCHNYGGDYLPWLRSRCWLNGTLTWPSPFTRVEYHSQIHRWRMPRSLVLRFTLLYCFILLMNTIFLSSKLTCVWVEAKENDDICRLSCSMTRDVCLVWWQMTPSYALLNDRWHTPFLMTNDICFVRLLFMHVRILLPPHSKMTIILS